MKIKLGPNSVRILKYILHYQDRNGFPPSLLEICKRQKLKSPDTVRYHLARIERAGIIKRNQRRARGIQIVDMARAVGLVNRLAS